MGHSISTVADGCTMSIAAAWDMNLLGSSKLIDNTLKKQLIKLGIQQSLKIQTTFGFDISEILETFDPAWDENEYDPEDEEAFENME